MNTAHSFVSNHLRGGRPMRIAAVLVAVMSMTMPAFAQLSRVGANPLLIAATIRGSDTAYDPVNRVYLNVGAHGALYGLFSNTSGDLLSSLRIDAGTGFPQFPRVTYSPHVSNGAGGFGGFLVTWHQEQGNTNFVNIRVVAYPDRLVSAQRVVSSPATWWESGPAVAYSPVSQNFMIAFRTIDYRIWGARIATNGEVINSFQISQAGFTGRDPSIAWNSGSNQFGVVYSGFTNSGASTGFTIVDAAGNALRHNIFNFAPGTYITDLAYNSAMGRYVAVWSQGATYGAEISAGGDVLGLGLVSSSVGKYDGLGVAYNPVSGTFLMVGHGATADVWGAELNARGARTSGEQPLTGAGGSGAFYPRAAARTDAPQWNVTFGHNFAALRDQVVTTSSAGGGPAGSLGGAPAPTPTTPTTGSCPGTAPFPGAVCVNGGWVPGTTSGGSTSTGGCPGTTPFPGAVCVNGGWVPGTISGGSTSTGGCPGTTPFPGAVCVNGGWVPGTTSGGSTSTGGCPGTTPFPGAVCVNGGWVPGTTSGGSTSTGSCPGTTPFPGAVCVNGGWVPGTTSGSASSGGCTTPDPFAAIGGGTCANGGWTPGRVSAPSTGSCPGTTPFPGAVCVNGGWVPGTRGSTGSCTSISPGAGWSCVNGGWLPPGAGGSCTSPSPGAGWFCVNGGWLPPNLAPADTGGCVTSDPFVAMGGGVCINGGWRPKSM